MTRVCALLLLAFAGACAADDRADFESLKQLVGTWQPADKPESPMRVTFELTAHIFQWNRRI